MKEPCFSPMAFQTTSLPIRMLASDTVHAVGISGTAGNQRRMDVHGGLRSAFSCLWRMAMNSFLPPQAAKYPPKCYIIPTTLESLAFGFTLLQLGGNLFPDETTHHDQCTFLLSDDTSSLVTISLLRARLAATIRTLDKLYSQFLYESFFSRRDRP